MSEYTKYSTAAVEANELQKKIRMKENLISEFVKFTKEILKKGGRETYYKEYNFHTNSNKELIDFYGFSFYGDFGQSQFGGNSIKISYKKKPVMGIYSQSSAFNPEEWRLDLFDNDSKWQNQLLTIIEKKEEYVVKAEALKKKSVKKNNMEEEIIIPIDILRKKALALKIE
jgi:hypothetical protein